MSPTSTGWWLHLHLCAPKPVTQHPSYDQFYRTLKRGTPRRGKSRGTLQQAVFCSAQDGLINSQIEQGITTNSLENVCFLTIAALTNQNTDKDGLINLAKWKNAPIMRSITVDTGGEQLLLLLLSSTAIYTVQIFARSEVCKYLCTKRKLQMF